MQEDKVAGPTQAELSGQQAQHRAMPESLSAEHDAKLSDPASRLQSSEEARERAASESRIKSAELAAKTRKYELVIAELRNRHHQEIAEIADKLRSEIMELNASKRSIEESLQERFSEIAILTAQVMNLEAKMDSAAASARQAEMLLKEKISQLEMSLRDANAKCHALQQRLEQAANLEASLRHESARAASLEASLRDSDEKNRALRQELERAANLEASLRDANELNQELQRQLDQVLSSRALKLAGAIRKAVGMKHVVYALKDPSRRAGSGSASGD